MGQVLAICDCETLYACRLTDYFNYNDILPFEAMAFDDSQKLEKYMDNHKVSVLMIDERMFCDKVYEYPVEEIVILSEGNVSDEKSEYPIVNPLDEQSENLTANILHEKSEYLAVREFSRIYKYQSAEEIGKALLVICSVSQGKLALETKCNKNVELIGIYSPVGRCLQTSFSLVLGQLLATNKKCLYINMEPYSGFNNLFGVHYDQNMSDLLYFLKKGSDRFGYKLKSTIERLGNLEYIPPAEMFLDLMDVDARTWQTFLQEIIKQTDYEVIILDLSDYVRGLVELLTSCDHIYTIIKKDGIAMAKIEQYEKMLLFTHNDAVLNKTKKFQFPIFKELPKQIERLTYSELAEYTKKLIEEDRL